MKLCVAAGVAVACTSVSHYPLDGLSVRDDGTVLYSVSNDACVYTDRVRAAHNDCDEMYRWKPVLPSPVLQGIGGDPQWLSEAQAAALIAYSHATKR